MTQPKLTIKESGQTPSEQAIAAASKTVTVTDPRGRKITIMKPNVLRQFDLIEMLEETAKNEVYVSMVLPLIYITEIDGVPVLPMSNKIQIRALIQQLGEDGINCVMTSVQQNFGKKPAGGETEAVKQ